MSNFLVYVHQNRINGKRYVGITSKLPSQRWKKGKGYTNHFRHAIDKYGWENFEHYVIAYGLTDKEAYAMERELIAQFNTTHPDYGYNISTGGEFVHTTHQCANHPLYCCYTKIKSKIGMCREWRDFLAFYNWCYDNGYQEGYCLVRKDTSNPHSPHNSVWVPKEQRTIFRQNYRKEITYQGITRTAQEWADITNISKNTILARLSKYHWGVQKTLTTPPPNIPKENRYLRKHGVGYRVDMMGNDKKRHISPVYRDINDARAERDNMVRLYKKGE